MPTDFTLDFDDEKPLPLEVDPYDLPKDMEPIFRAEAIDLTGCNLTELPEWLRECKHLLSLDLSRNRMTTLPRWLSELTTLTHLNLQGNYIEHTPWCLRVLPHLKKLDLGNNPISNLDDIHHLESLSLGNKGLRRLSAAIGNFPQLKYLDISQNSLSEIPEWIGSCEQLRSLDIGFNDLANLPDWLPQLIHLEELDVTLNPMSHLPEWLKNFTGLKKFRLGYLNLEVLPEWISSFSHLEDLDISRSSIQSLPEWLLNLQKLQTLDLGSSTAQLPEWFDQLSCLRDLSLDGCTLAAVPDCLQALTHLRRLDIGSNKLETLPVWMSQFEQLRDLDISFNSLLSLPEWLWHLSHLRRLNISRSGVTTIPPQIGCLVDLEQLRLNSLDLTSLPEELGKLKRLRELHLYNNLLSALPDSLQELTELRHINLSLNRLGALPKWLSQLRQLRTLHANKNHITTLPDDLSALRNLESLFATSNPLRSLSRHIGELPRLRALGITTVSDVPLPDWLQNKTDLNILRLPGCRIKSVPEWLHNFRLLNVLGLEQNTIQTLPPWLGELKHLRTLDLDNNQLIDLPETLAELPFLDSLHLRKNPRLNIPPELSERFYKNAQDILTYYFKTRLEAGGKPLREVKVLVVGEGEVGKTSLIKHLLGEAKGGAFDKREQKTEGIVRHKMPLVCPEKGEITLNIWDFGGQEIMHSTHQFFLTERSIYLLVLDSRHNEGQSRVEYWLKLIQSFGGNSPVIVVCNKCDQQPMQLNWNGLQEKYPQIKHYARRVSCFVDKGQKVDKRQGLEELRELIALTVAKDVAHVDTPFRPEWLKLKSKLEKDRREVIQEAQFDKACATCKVDKEDRKFLLRFLHDLGLVLHFADHTLMKDSHVKDTHVLNPGWVTAAVYRLLNDHQLNQNHGRLGYEYFKQVLQTVPDHNYAGHEDFIWQMMSRFQLGFEFEKPGTTERTMLVPDLLQKEEGSRGSWAGSLAFVYEYTVLPQSVVSRFIVAMHRHIKPNSAWRYGAVLEWDGCQARVKADLEDRRLEIQVQGDITRRRSLLDIIREKLETIHDGFSEKLGVEEFVPVPGHPGKKESYRKLIQMERDGETSVYIQDVGRIPLDQLLSGVTLSRRRQDLEQHTLQQERQAVRNAAESQQAVAVDDTSITPHTNSEGLDAIIVPSDSSSEQQVDKAAPAPQKTRKMKKKFSGPEIGRLRDVYCEVFDPASFEMFLHTVMDRRVYNYAPPGDFPLVVYKLLDKANMQFWAPELVQKVAAEFPDYEDIQNLSRELNATVPASPVMPFSLETGLALERIVKEGTKFQDFDAFLGVLKQTSRSVCRVALPGGGGTGFLVAPNLVITNFHVVKQVLDKQVLLTDVTFVFGHIRNIDTGEILPGETVKADPDWQIIYRRFSPGDKSSTPSEPAPEHLDYALLRLESAVATGPLSTAKNGAISFLELAGASAITEGNPLFIFQHPQPEKGQPQLPLQIGHGVTTRSPWPAKRTRHDVPTRRGASGSPCFDRDLRLTAIHHAGNPESELPLYNQAIPIQAIVADLNRREEEFKKQGVAPFWR